MFLDERVDVSGIEIENVVAVRYECTQKGSGNKWPSMREFKVSTTPETGVEFTKEDRTDGLHIKEKKVT